MKKKYSTEEERKAAKAARMKQWREKHKAEIVEYYMQWYQDHKEEKAVYAKQYQTEHKTDIAVQRKQYREDHKEEIAAYRKQYQSSIFGRAVQLANAYKRLDDNAGRGECTITADWIVENVFSGQVCHYCGESDWTKLGVDRKDSSLPHTPENCVPCCKACNNKKGKTSYEEYLKKVS